MTTHLFKRGGRYYIRRRIPTDLLPHYQGKKEIQRSLNTNNPKEAAINVRSAGAQLDSEFEAYRQALAAITAAKDTTAAPRPTAVYEPLTGLYVLSIPVTITKEQAEEEERTDREGAEATYEPLDKQIQDHDRAVSAYARLGQVIDLAVSRALKTASTDLAAPSPILTQPVTGAATASRAAHTFDSLVALWAKERQPDKRTLHAFERAVRRFKDLIGEMPVTRVDRATIVLFKDKMAVDGHTGSVTDRSIELLTILFNYAIGQAWIETNPAKGVKVGERKYAKSARLPFNEAALNAIFHSQIYAEGVRPRGGAQEASYWLPLLGLYTGARIEELCQLHPEDVYEEAYRDGHGKAQRCWVIRVTDSGEGQGVKNAGSVRRFPIHAELLKRGFLEYVEAHKGQRRVFPALKPDGYGVESTNWIKWWMKHIRKDCMVTNPRMVFHSFRHTFKDVCRECGITKEHADALQGHSEGDAAGNYGAEFYPLRPLVEAMERYQVHGVQLPA